MRTYRLCEEFKSFSLVKSFKLWYRQRHHGWYTVATHRQQMAPLLRTEYRNMATVSTHNDHSSDVFSSMECMFPASSSSSNSRHDSSTSPYAVTSDQSTLQKAGSQHWHCAVFVTRRLLRRSRSMQFDSGWHRTKKQCLGRHACCMRIYTQLQCRGMRGELATTAADRAVAAFGQQGHIAWCSIVELAMLYNSRDGQVSETTSRTTATWSDGDSLTVSCTVYVH